MEDLLNYLETKGLKPKVVEGGDEARCKCPFCEKDGHLYIVMRTVEKEGKTRNPGLFKCMKCDTKGALPKLKRHLGDAPDIWTPGDLNINVFKNVFRPCLYAFCCTA
jgi:hypothetical protein